MRPVMIDDARGVARPLTDGPRRREWPKLPWWGASRQMGALGEPWVTEAGVARRAAVFYGLSLGVLISVISIGCRVLLPDGLLGLSRDWTALWFGLLGAVLFRVVRAPITRSTRKSDATELIVAYLKADQCPSCRSPLYPAHSENAAQRCPKCGGEWVIPPATS